MSAHKHSEYNNFCPKLLIQNLLIRQRKITGIFRMVLFWKEYLKQEHVGIVNYFGIRWATKTITQNALEPQSLPTNSRFPRKSNLKTAVISPYNAYCSTICILCYLNWFSSYPPALTFCFILKERKHNSSFLEKKTSCSLKSTCTPSAFLYNPHRTLLWLFLITALF